VKNVDFAHSAFTTADLYERGRSGYPTEAVDWLLGVLGVGAASTVVDLAAGTGKLTRLMVPAAARVVAVEPVKAMREELARVVAGARVAAGTAEAIPFATASADAMTVAQAFHWFDPGRALPEMHRVLRPGGRLGLVWNRADTTVPWVARLDALRSPKNIRPSLRTFGRDPQAWVAEATEMAKGILRGARTKAGGGNGAAMSSPSALSRSGLPARSGPKRGAADPWWVARCRNGFASTALFTPLESKTFRHAERMNPDRLVDWVASFSRFAKLPPDRQARVKSAVRDLATRELASEFDFPYRTDVFWTSAR